MPKFKNVSKQVLNIPDIGIVQPGATVEAPDDFHNGNFERVKVVDSWDNNIKEK